MPTVPDLHPRVQAILDELRSARDALHAAVADIDPALLETPGLVGEWSARDLLAHLAYWSGHAAEAIHHAEQERLDEFGRDELSVDERNAVVARVAQDTELATVRARELAAFEALETRITRLDPDWLDEHAADGDSLAEIIADDGAEHYREHTADVRAWFSGEPEPDAGE